MAKKVYDDIESEPLLDKASRIDLTQVQGCALCQIFQSNIPAEIVYRDQDFIVLVEKINPASDHHYCVVPRWHIHDSKLLTQEHIPIIEMMTSIGQKVLEERGGDFSDARLGFYYKPFMYPYKGHMNLHVVAPVAKMSWFRKNLELCPKNGVIYTPSYLIECLKNPNNRKPLSQRFKDKMR